MINKDIRRIAVIDDEQRILSGIEHHFSQIGYIVDIYNSGKEFFKKYTQEPSYQRDLAVLILDMNMPDMDGETILRRIRESAKSRQLQIIVYATEGSEFDKTHMIEIGADDYLLKSTPLSGLAARIEARFRTRELFFSAEAPRIIGGIEIDNVKGIIYFDGIDLEVSETEFKLLSTLIENRDEPMSYIEIKRLVFGSAEMSSDAVKTTVSRLRKRIETNSPRFKDCIITIRSHGLQFVSPGEVL